MAIALDKEHRWWALAVVALIAALMGIAYKFARPGLPSEVVMSTGAAAVPTKRSAKSTRLRLRKRASRSP